MRVAPHSLHVVGGFVACGPGAADGLIVTGGLVIADWLVIPSASLIGS
jgi:hypothetical protein